MENSTKMNRLVLLFAIFVLILNLKGCYQKADQHDIRNAIEFCGDVSKVLYIRVDFVGGEAARCVSGETETWF